MYIVEKFHNITFSDHPKCQIESCGVENLFECI